MRDIKFRGKRIDNGKWVYGYLVRIKNSKQIETFAIKETIYHVNDSVVNLIPEEVIPETVGQYTSLEDKNGKEIYEGSIILIEDKYKEVICDDGSGPTESSNHICEVEFNGGCFGVHIIFSADIFTECRFYSFDEILINVSITDLEIIGNIPDNPELLEAK